MLSPVSSLARELERSWDQPLNIGTFVCHERFDPNLARTGHNFYAFPGKDVREWNHQYSPVPENYHILRGNRLPPDVHLDCFIVGNGGVHIPVAKQLMGIADIPIINVHHVLPHPGMPPEYLVQIKESVAPHVVRNVFITEYNRAIWQYSEAEADVIYHGIDTNLFRPSESDKRENYVLSVANDFINRDWALGFSLWREVVENHVAAKPVGNTPGLSVGAPNLPALIREYQTASVFFNSSQHSPIPMSLLEAAACGCAIVTTANCAIPLLFEHGVNALMSNDPVELRGFLKELLANPKKARELGAAARYMVMEKCGMERFINEWNGLLGGLL
jgi:glycosyltransferase involved in cell wall biosynthesis